jgi:hypothetical protein
MSVHERVTRAGVSVPSEGALGEAHQCHQGCSQSDDRRWLPFFAGQPLSRHDVSEPEPDAPPVLADHDGAVLFGGLLQRLGDLLVVVCRLVGMNLRVVEGNVAVIGQPVAYVVGGLGIDASDDLRALVLRLLG